MVTCILNLRLFQNKTKVCNKYNIFHISAFIFSFNEANQIRQAMSPNAYASTYLLVSSSYISVHVKKTAIKLKHGLGPY